MNLWYIELVNGGMNQVMIIMMLSWRITPGNWLDSMGLQHVMSPHFSGISQGKKGDESDFQAARLDDQL